MIKFEKMEALQMEFELESGANPNISGFATEVKDKLEVMANLKKTWSMFQMKVELYLKKADCTLHLHPKSFVPAASTDICLRYRHICMYPCMHLQKQTGNC